MPVGGDGASAPPPEPRASRARSGSSLGVLARLAGADAEVGDVQGLAVARQEQAGRVLERRAGVQHGRRSPPAAGTEKSAGLAVSSA